MIALSAGGRRAAIWSALNPPQDLPMTPDRAGAPRLAGDPGDDVGGVVVLLLRVLVAQEAVGVAGAADVDAYRGVAVAGEVAVHGLVTPRA